MSEADRIVSDYARRSAEVDPERYAVTNPAALFIRQTLERALVGELGRAGVLPLAGRRILDAGCGAGQWLADLETWGASREGLAGIDLVPERVERARSRLPGADIRHGDASELPWEDGRFDLVLQSMMFSSILDRSMRVDAAREFARVLRPQGLVVWYDFFTDSPGNKGARGVGRRELQELFPGFEMHWRRVILAPPLIRLLVPRARPLAAALQSLRLLNTHALALLRRAV
jgi:ubiquinone/menaquinone biosynthesis C-methylase UbiE